MVILASPNTLDHSANVRFVVISTLVPEGIKSWIKLRVGSLYTHREEMAVLSRGRIDPLPFVQGLLDPYRVALV